MVKNNVNELEDILLEDNINYKKLARFINVNESKWTAKKLYEEDGFWMTEALGSYSRMMCEKLKIEADDIHAGFGIVINDDGSISVGMTLHYERVNKHGENEYATLTFVNEECCSVWYDSTGGNFEIHTGDFEITRLNFWGAYKGIAFAI